MYWVSMKKIRITGTKRVIILIAASVVGLVMLATGYFFACLYNKSAVQIPPESFFAEDDQDISVLYFIRDGDVYTFDSNGNTQKIISGGGDKVHFFALGSGGRVVYYTSSWYKTEGGDEYFDDKDILLYDPQKGESLSLLAKVPVPDNQEDVENSHPYFGDQVAISHDKNVIAFSPYHKNLYLYYMDQDKLEEIVMTPNEDDFCTHFTPSFWLGTKSLVLMQGCYEGAKNVLYDIEQKKVIAELGFMYVSGDSAEDALGEDLVLMRKYGFESADDEVLYSLDWQGNKKEIVTYPRILSGISGFSQENIYFVASTKSAPFYTVNGPWEVWKVKLDGSGSTKMTNDNSELRSKMYLRLDDSGNWLTYSDAPVNLSVQEVAKSTEHVSTSIINLRTGERAVFENAFLGSME